MKRTLILLSLGLSTLSTSCSTVGVTGQVGYTNMSVGGNMALASGTGGVPSSANQDVGSAFGLGEGQGSPYLRGQIDCGVPVFTASGFLFEEAGSGVLNATFGGLSASTPVNSTLEFANLKLSSTFDIDLGPVKVSPGLGLDLFDLRFKATETTLGNSEEIDELVPVPMLFVRGEADLFLCSLVAEAGYLQTPDINGTKASCLDLEAMLEWSLAPMVQVFAGYRRIDIDWRGETDTESYDLSLTVDGWMIGGGLRF
ncbi:MAG: hypothetical protein IT456_14490 [Planctomycetes bacterium]|nr:hypothetical protein [Planctomycetota bacterium]